MAFLGKKWDTSSMSRNEWEMARQHGPEGDLDFCLGGSDMGTVLGLSKFSTPRQLFLEKTGKIPKEEISPEKALRFEIGHISEKQIAELFELVTGYKVRDDLFMYQHPAYPWALANLDRRFDTDEEKDLILEIKTVAYGAKDAWADGMVPPAYEAQVRFYMAVLNVPKAAIIGCWGYGASDFSITYLERDLEIEEQMFQKGEHFIEMCREGEMPEVSGTDPERDKKATTAYLYPFSGEETVTLPKEALSLFVEYKKLDGRIKEISQESKELDKAKAALQTQFLDLLGENRMGVLEDGSSRYSVKITPMAPVRLDTEALKKELPDIFEQYSRPVVQSPRFTVK